MTPDSNLPLGQQNGREVIEREDLIRVVDQASEGCRDSTRRKLRAVAETTDAFAVGWFHCNGVSCPARQARRPNQRFQEAFDGAMAERFGRDLDEALDRPFVVAVRRQKQEVDRG